MRKLGEYQGKVLVPEGSEVKILGKTVELSNKRAKISRKFESPLVNITYDPKDKKITLKAKTTTKKHKCILNTYEAHLNNMVKGLSEDFVYELKVCSTHFPVTASVVKDEFIVKNYLGEKIPRKFKLPLGVKVEVAGEIIKVSSPNLETAGMVAGRIEQLTRICDRDRRVFGDGIWMTLKKNKKL